MIVIRRIVTAWLLLGIFSVQAESGDSQTRLQAGLLYIEQEEQGLVTNIPAHDVPEILQRVQSFHAKLKTRQAQCEEDVESTRFKTHDTLITIVMPGGLLYAMGKQQRHAAAKQSFTQVSQQLHDLQSDLARLRASSSEETFALLD
jgi:hypothetical protein